VIDVEEDRAEQTFGVTTRQRGRPEQVGTVTVSVHHVDPEPLQVRLNDSSDEWETDEGTPWLTITYLDLDPIERPVEVTRLLARQIENATAWSYERYVQTGGDGAIACELAHLGYSVPREFRSELVSLLLGDGCAHVIRASDPRMGIDIGTPLMNKLVRSVADSLNSIARLNSTAIIGAISERLSLGNPNLAFDEERAERIQFELGVGVFHVRESNELVVRPGLSCDVTDILDGIGNWPLIGWAKLRAMAVESTEAGGTALRRFELGPALLATVTKPLVLRTRTPRRPDTV
jgi:hypothetical protein